MYREESKFLPYVFYSVIQSLDVVVSAFCMRIARGKNILIYLSVQRKAVPLQADYYQKFIKN